MNLVTLRDVSFSHGGPPLFSGVDLSIEPGDRIGLTGRNGAGKSTLLRLVEGLVAPTSGTVSRAPEVTVATLAQLLPEDLSGTVFDAVADGLGEGGERLKRYHHLTQSLGAAPTPRDLAELDRLQRAIERDGGFALEQRVDAAISRIGLDPEARVEVLSVGLKRRVLMARALASGPDLLLLDEPTNHLDLDGIEWLETFLLKWPGALLCVTHDRAFLRRLATRVVHVERGAVKSYACDYGTFVRRREADLEAEDRANAVLDRKLAREEEWNKQGVKARRTKAVARVKQLEELREARRDRPKTVGRVRVGDARVERSGNLVAELLRVSFGFDDGPNVIDDFSTMVMRGDKIGVMGKNGAGKTTLLRLLLGDLAPRSGTIRHGVKLEVGHFDQLHQELDEDATLAENVTPNDSVDIGDGRRKHIVGYLQGFLFTREQVHGSIKHLSGGERNRVLLARLFAHPSNVLVLDEPTNDLDAETIEVLEERLVAYSGTVLLVSHDREFLNHVVTSTLVVEDGGRVGEYDGGYDDWLLQRAAPPEPPKPAKKQPAREKPEAGRAGKRMLSRAERTELAALPDRIEELEAELASLHEQMADPEFYAKEPAEMARVHDRVKAIETALETAYGRWADLEPHG